MGNRAIVVFKDQHESAAVYMHWNGGPESVYTMLGVMQEFGLNSHSAGYSAARFIMVASSVITGPLSLGTCSVPKSLPKASANEGLDNGVYLFEVGGVAKITRYGRNGKAPQAEVDAEQRIAAKHRYNQPDAEGKTMRDRIVERLGSMLKD